jgi:hypothetical protein
MKLISSLLLAATLSLGAGAAMAACPDTSASTDMNKTGAIAKDGTQAPMEGADPGAANTPAKDGSTMPLATEEGGNKDLATSQQDVEAQQDGEKTAAATAEDDKCKE